MVEALGLDGDDEVGFPRRDDLGTSPDGYRERDFRRGSQPAFALTEKGRSWVIRTGANTMKHSRRVEDVVRYERDGDRPSPTVDAKAGSAWTLHTNRGQDEQGNRQTVVGDRPAPGFTAKAGSQWDLVNGELRRKLRLDEALTLQSFPPDYPVFGTKTSAFRQVGNAIPPLLARAILAELLR